MSARIVGIGAVVAAAAAALAYGAYQWGVRSGMTTATPPNAGATQAAPASERKVLYWHDPMAPGQRFDKPGKSPFMDMQLVPVYADEARGPGVAVDPTVAQNLGLRTSTVRRASIAHAVEAVGNVTQNERATVVVQSRVSGYVEKLFVRAALDPVAQGQPLVTIFAPEWSGAIAEYLGLARANVDPAIVAAARQRLRLQSIPDDVVDRSLREGSAQSRFTLTSPAAGVVAELGVREGVMVQPGMALFRIVDLSTVWVEASVPEAQGAQVRDGAPARARTDAYPGRTFAGKVSAILPQLDVATRTLRVRIELANPGTVLKPGMFVSVTLGSPAAASALVVPQEAVIATGKRTVVIVAGDDNRLAPVEVTVGRPADADVEIRSGLAEGQRVVTSGQFMIDSEASLKSALSRLSSVAPDAKPAAKGSYRGEGTIERVGKDEITLSHGPIPALKWPAMTMDFAGPAQGSPAGLKAGDDVTFEFVQKGDTWQLTRIERKGAIGAKP